MSNREYPLFQSRTGFPGHLALAYQCAYPGNQYVSIPNGLPRPFSQLMLKICEERKEGFNPERASQAI